MRLLRGWRLSLAGGVAALAFGIAAAAGMGFDGGAQALTNCTVADNSVDSEEQAFLGLINAYRAQNGKGALTISTNLGRAATWHGGDMGTKNYFSHTDSLGRSPSTRAQNCDYPGGAGENIAAGTNWSSAQSVFNAWKASSGHNANMLNGGYTKIGIARVYTAGSQYSWYWVTDFGLVDDGTGSGGAATATPTRTPTRTPTQAAQATPTSTPPPASGSPASISSPSNGSTLPGSSATFSWGAASGALEYFFYAGSGVGSNSIVGRSTGTSTSTTVTNLPTNGSTVNVRLWTRFASGWQFRDYAYTAASSSGGTSLPAGSITSPINGSQLTGTTETFQWSATSGAQQYWFYMGSTPGGYNIANVNTGLNRSVQISNIPRGGQMLYVRVWVLLSTGSWTYSDYQYRAAP